MGRSPQKGEARLQLCAAGKMGPERSRPDSAGDRIFYGKLGGTISWGAGTKAAVTKTCDLIRIGDETVGQLIEDGTLQPGDIVTYVDIQHTNIYAGNGKWYDAGHAYCSGTGEGAVYKSWHGEGQYNSQKAGYIIREKSGADSIPYRPAPSPSSPTRKNGSGRSKRPDLM